MVLADSNILIYATQPEHAKLRQWLLDTLPKASIISRVEILGYHKLQDAEQAALTENRHPVANDRNLPWVTPSSQRLVLNGVTPLQRPTSAILNGLRN
ncbi:MAG: PIN domain-containing protein [Thiobacillus sp.]